MDTIAGTRVHRPLLAHLSESELSAKLHGYPESALAAARNLRNESPPAKVEAFLFAFLGFFLPAGTTPRTGEVRSDLRLREDLGLDSLALAEAMFKLEELIDIRVENAELAEITTLSDATRLLIEKSSATPTV